MSAKRRASARGRSSRCNALLVRSLAELGRSRAEHEPAQTAAPQADHGGYEDHPELLFGFHLADAGEVRAEGEGDTEPRRHPRPQRAISRDALEHGAQQAEAEQE